MCWSPEQIDLLITILLLEEIAIFRIKLPKGWTSNWIICTRFPLDSPVVAFRKSDLHE